MADLDVRYDLNPASIFQNCPEDSGVYTIESAEGDVLFIAFTRNLTQGVTRHLPENELRNQVIASRGRFFRFYLTEDEAFLAQIFDAYVQRKGRFPAGMQKAPQGSAWAGKRPPGGAATSPQPEPEAPSQPPAEAAGAGARTVILVDDDVQLLVLMKELLEVEGHKVYAAANGKMLTKAVAVPHVDVLVLDYHLADLTARQVIDTVRKHHPEVLIFMITGTTHKEQAYELLQAGVRKIFPKPFSMKMLARAIREHFAAA